MKRWCGPECYNDFNDAHHTHARLSEVHGALYDNWLEKKEEGKTKPAYFESLPLVEQRKSLQGIRAKLAKFIDQQTGHLDLSKVGFYVEGKKMETEEDFELLAEQTQSEAQEKQDDPESEKREEEGGGNGGGEEGEL